MGLVDDLILPYSVAASFSAILFVPALAHVVSLSFVALFRLFAPAVDGVGLWWMKHVAKAPVRSLRVTRFELLIVCAFGIGNLLSIGVGTSSLSTLSYRCAFLSMINATPLMLGEQLSLLGKLFHIRSDSWSLFHRVLGTFTVTEALIHCALRLHSLNDTARTGMAILTSVGIACTILSTLLLKPAYDLFLWVHRLSNVVFMVGLYLHITPKPINDPVMICYVIAAGVRLLSASVMISSLIQCNFSMRLLRYQKEMVRTKEKERSQLWIARSQTILFLRFDLDRRLRHEHLVEDAIHLHVEISWRFQPGQYVYLSLPQLGLGSWITMHPFYIAWTYKNDCGTEVAVILVCKRSGFTSTLVSRTVSGWRSKFGSKTDRKVDIDPELAPQVEKETVDFSSVILRGPYGQELNLRGYETVILFATDVGIAGQLPYATRLLQEFGRPDSRVGRIALYWKIESESQAAWAAEYLSALYRQDHQSRILDIKLFVAGNTLPLTDPPLESNFPDVNSQRFEVSYGTMDLEKLINYEIERRVGGMVVSLCVDRSTSAIIHDIVRRRMDGSIDIKECEFHPSRKRAGRF